MAENQYNELFQQWYQQPNPAAWRPGATNWVTGTRDPLATADILTGLTRQTMCMAQFLPPDVVRDNEVEAFLRKALNTGSNIMYVWGGGGANVPFPEGAATDLSDGVKGYDCSGLVLSALAGLGVIPTSFPRLRARDLIGYCDTIEIGKQRPGDLVFYYPRKTSTAVGHVTLVLTKASEDSKGTVLGAQSGNSGVHGAKVTAYVREVAINKAGNRIHSIGRWRV